MDYQDLKYIWPIERKQTNPPWKRPSFESSCAPCGLHCQWLKTAGNLQKIQEDPASDPACRKKENQNELYKNGESDIIL